MGIFDRNDRTVLGSPLAPATGGGGGSPAGANTQIQFNNSGAFGADAAMSWVSGTKTLELGENSYILIKHAFTGSVEEKMLSMRVDGTFGFDISVDSQINGDLYINRVVSGSATEALRIKRASGIVQMNAYGAGFAKFDSSGNVSSVNGATGTFTTVDSKTVTVTDGLITSIV